MTIWLERLFITNLFLFAGIYTIIVVYDADHCLVSVLLLVLLNEAQIQTLRRALRDSKQWDLANETILY